MQDTHFHDCSSRVPIANQGIWLDCPDLRDHRAYLADHPGASTITTAQVSSFIVFLLVKCRMLYLTGQRVMTKYLTVSLIALFTLPLVMQGEELRKQIGAAAYIECSSKTQQVVMSNLKLF